MRCTCRKIMIVVSLHSKMMSTTILISCGHFYDGNCQLTYSLQQLHVVGMRTCLMMAETFLSSITVHLFMRYKTLVKGKKKNLIHDCWFVFRWETLDSFMQHDVQELCRVVRLPIKSFIICMELCYLFLRDKLKIHAINLDLVKFHPQNKNKSRTV